jgi:hypothetical protein
MSWETLSWVGDAITSGAKLTGARTDRLPKTQRLSRLRALRGNPLGVGIGQIYEDSRQTFVLFFGCESHESYLFQLAESAAVDRPSLVPIDLG